MRDFVHVRDVARANLLAPDSETAGALNIASGEPRTVPFGHDLLGVA